MNYFNEFLKEIMALPFSVFESSTFQYDENLSSTIFDFNHSIDFHSFMNVFISSSGPPSCLSWIVILHRIADVEFVIHQVQCDACHRQHFTGFRYKCQKCFNCTLCQDCFWRGRSTSSHNADTHPCKEFAYWKSPTKQIGHSIRRSFRCLPSNKRMINFGEDPVKDKRFDLKHIVPPSPVPSIHSYNGFSGSHSDSESYGGSKANSFQRSITSQNRNDTPAIDEEHQLISRYTAKLAKGINSDVSLKTASIDVSQQKAIIAKLEARNREIMKEIARLRQEQNGNAEKDAKYRVTDAFIQQDPTLLSELAGLRRRKEELEQHLGALQDSRRELMIQLEGLMKLLKSQGTLSATSSGNNSASSTLNRNQQQNISKYPSALSQSNSTVTSATHANRDILVAADSVTNAVSSMVKELNSEDEAEELINQLKEKATLSEEKSKKKARIDKSKDEEFALDDDKLVKWLL